MRTQRKTTKHELGQVLPLMGFLTFVVLGLGGLAVDIGKLYLAQAQLGRSVDAAALAGAKQLPNMVTAETQARAYIGANDSDATLAVTVYADPAAQQVRVVARKNVSTVFMRVFGIRQFTVQNEATAGFGIVAVDAVMAIDATSSMGDAPCNGSQNNSGCPIWEAKNAAKSFTNTLLPSANTVIGVHAFRGCFKPGGTNAGCVLLSSVGALDATAANVITKINGISASGGTGTNVCGGLDEAGAVLFGAGSHAASNTVRVIVILSDGDNNYNSASYVAGSPGAPLAACRPTTTGCPVSPSSNCSPTSSDSSPSCGAGQPRERQLDTFTKTRANQLKAAGTAIYVVAFGVCGTEDNQLPTAAYCGNIGNANADTVADQRLLKCVAGSTPGTNDHYYRANTAAQLPGIFTQIAQHLAFRLVK